VNQLRNEKAEVELLRKKILELIMSDGGKKAATLLTNLINHSTNNPEKKSEKSHYIRKVK
jgi:hypothetical protein